MQSAGKCSFLYFYIQVWIQRMSIGCFFENSVNGIGVKYYQSAGSLHHLFSFNHLDSDGFHPTVIHKSTTSWVSRGEKDMLLFPFIESDKTLMLNLLTGRNQFIKS